MCFEILCVCIAHCTDSLSGCNFDTVLNELLNSIVVDVVVVVVFVVVVVVSFAVAIAVVVAVLGFCGNSVDFAAGVVAVVDVSRIWRAAVFDRGLT